MQQHVRAVQETAGGPEPRAAVRRLREWRQGHVPGRQRRPAAGADAQEPVHLSHRRRDVVWACLCGTQFGRRVHARLVVPGLAGVGGVDVMQSIGRDVIGTHYCEDIIYFVCVNIYFVCIVLLWGMYLYI